ncbi:protein PHLOEM PROTEIN 2-LIKE A2 [Dendrobium catenatum]|uniref:Protein PHLOEM PROTEIN 2-LIKE A2 n=1 Tax=Dendrobium catenatum TaxID=906689 RepID=A0A2I0X1J7_9ASPA|nr:protein PHLOEM PROTEIN 2-LIKE A2 [Dendrobium catenatum]PKU81780.1 Protein PHLOEM PROTEIN 2-LIKE A2 [Dendrobium catenatum]
MKSDHQKGETEGNIEEWEKLGKRGLTLNTRAVNIIWGGNEKNWRRRAEENYGVMELLGVYWLEITGRIPLKILEPNTPYRLYFNIKLIPSASGFDLYPVIFKLHVNGTKVSSTEVNLSNYIRSSWVDLPEEGLKFSVPKEKEEPGALTFSMHEIECEEWKKGIVIRELKLMSEKACEATT